jgi:hypothetical protein
MNNFWTNIVRYPRFFIGSMIGLVLVIITPFRNLFKTPKLRLFLILFSLVFILSLYFIIRTMVGLFIKFKTGKGTIYLKYRFKV